MATGLLASFNHIGQRLAESVGLAPKKHDSQFKGILADQPLERPQISDPTTEESFEKYKEYNIDVNQRANERRFWAGLVDRLAGYILTGAAAGIGVVLIGEPGSSNLVSATLTFLGAFAATAASFFMLHQTTNREVTAKSMDVSDYHVKREAALIAKELKKAFGEEGLVADIHRKNEPSAPEASKRAALTPEARISAIIHEGQPYSAPSQQIH